jgi:hypothetical protein
MWSAAASWDVLKEPADEHRSGRPVRMAEHIPNGPDGTRRIRALLTDDPCEFMHPKGPRQAGLSRSDEGSS